MRTNRSRNSLGASWDRFRVWRRSGPFWAGLFTLLSGLVILIPPFGTFKIGNVIVSFKTLGGVSAALLGTVLLMCAIAFWIRPMVRVPAGIVTLVAALIAVITVNLGGFVIGTLLGVLGGALGLAWVPGRGTEQLRSSSNADEHEDQDREGDA